MLPIGRTTSTWSECGCPALRGEAYSFHVARCPVRSERRRRVRRILALAGLGVAGGLLCAWVAACSYGAVRANGDIEGFACLSGRIERCHAIPAPTPVQSAAPGSTPTPIEVCDRIVGGDMGVTGWGSVVSVVGAITALLVAHPFW